MTAKTQPIILETSLNENRPEEFSIFKWHRDVRKDGSSEGYWVSQTMTGGGIGCQVCVDLQRELIKIAIEEGLKEEHNFALQTAKPEKPKKSAAAGGGFFRRRKKKKDDKKKKGFNPFG